MSEHDSKQTKQWEAVGHSPLQPNELHGRKRIAFCQFQADRDAEGEVIAQNDTVRGIHIPAGARLTGGKFKHGAFGASVTLDIGLRGADGSGYIDAANSVADDPDAIATNIDISAAGSFDLFEELAYLFYETEKELILDFKFEGANPADDKELAGYIEYVVD